MRPLFPAAFIALSLGLSCSQVMASAASPEGVPDSSPTAPTVAIENYRPVALRCVEGERQALAIRAYAQGGVDFLLTVDPQTLQTRLEKAAALVCDAAPDHAQRLLTGTPYLRAMNAERSHENLVQDGGITQSLRPTNGYFLTADLCPSSKPGFNEQLFETLEQARAIHASSAIPVALSVSGGWLQKHAQAFAWLRSEEAAGRLHITWVNHTATHPYSKQLDLNHNFMREAGIDPLAEVLGLEQLLVQQNVAPSVFFRFPGLVSSPELIEMLERLHLVAVGSDAWLAKGEQPTPGGVILVHANLNEPLGVELLLKWIARQQKGSVTFLPLEAVAGSGS